MVWALLESAHRTATNHLFVAASIGTFLLAGVLCFLLGHAEPGNENRGLRLFRYCFPATHWRSASTRTDIAFYLLGKLSQKWVTAASALAMIALAERTAQLFQRLTGFKPDAHAGTVAVVTVSLAIFVFADLGEYLSHLVQHKVPILWEYHKVHHSATFLTPFTTYRFHPLGNLLDGLLMGVCAAVPVGVAELLYGFTFPQLMAMSAGAGLVLSIVLLTSLQHSHFQIGFGILEWIFISPRMHQLHHSVKQEHWGKSLGSRLSVWDWCFGTGFRLPKGEKLEFGLGTVEDARGDYGLWWCYVGPIVHSCRIVGNTVSGKLLRKKQPTVIAG